MSLTPLQRRRISLNQEGTAVTHPRVSIAVFLYPSLFTYAFYFVIAIVLEVIYLAIIVACHA